MTGLEAKEAFEEFKKQGMTDDDILGTLYKPSRNKIGDALKYSKIIRKEMKKRGNK